jgi:hypothetical protein
MKNWILGFLFVVALSIDGWGCSAAPVDGEPDWSARTTIKTSFKDDGILYLSAPDPKVQEMLFSVAEFYLDQSGLQVAVVPSGGRPVVLGPLVEGVGGNSHTDFPCIGSDCSDPIYGVVITINEDFWPEASYTLRWNVLAHEVAHVFSSWGTCYTGEDVDKTGSHLGTPNHVMSPRTIPDAVWDELDDALVCSCGEC